MISNLSIGGAQILLYDLLVNLKKNNEVEISVVAIDSGEYIDKYRNAGIIVRDLREKGLLNLNIFIKLWKLFKYEKPDIVHTHLNKADFYGRITARLTGVNVIYSTCHNYSTIHSGANLKKKSIFDHIDNYVVKFSISNLIAISNLVKEYLVNRNSEFEKITEVIYNGIDIEKEKYLLDENGKAEFRKKFNIAKTDFIISLVGRLEKQKGHLFFLNSVNEFLKQNSNVKVIIAGDGSLKNEIENFINCKLLTNQVILTGFIKEVDPIIEISDLIVVPSLWEGFGLILAEGMIKKKIILASNVGGIPEIIEDKKTGFLFEPLNKDDFIENLNYIYDNIGKLDEIKNNALLRVKRKFDIKKNSELYYESYLSKLLKKNHKKAIKV